MAGIRIESETRLRKAIRLKFFLTDKGVLRDCRQKSDVTNLFYEKFMGPNRRYWNGNRKKKSKKLESLRKR